MNSITEEKGCSATLKLKFTTSLVVCNGLSNLVFQIQPTPPAGWRGVFGELIHEVFDVAIGDRLHWNAGDRVLSHHLLIRSPIHPSCMHTHNGSLQRHGHDTFKKVNLNKQEERHNLKSNIEIKCLSLENS